ncbi:hypothetical protein CAPTEDRAFT_203050 [Capitella teleta]|uniref:Farnesoic acid O-methyl transferase domain-containing protein n=1 Tax=Capitella teleta TaxID=283909 RepID=R7TR86_CAPTE|nr:hypothetical protein CAPTEDRAFT_203050 [Capitella teleta]|eukprot:ELT96413.1 hypothetical protein CAPTEDRAFT_203050 [Capitella teleta]
MKIFLVLTLALFADFAMGDIDMCYMERQTVNNITLVNHYPENNYIYFGIVACPEALLELVGNFNFYYSIRLGQEKLKTAAVQIMKYTAGGLDVLWSSDQVLLNCNEVKYFWMKWSEGELAIGQGLELGSRTLYTINDADEYRQSIGSGRSFEMNFYPG